MAKKIFKKVKFIKKGPGRPRPPHGIPGNNNGGHNNSK